MIAEKTSRKSADLNRYILFGREDKILKVQSDPDKKRIQ